MLSLSMVVPGLNEEEILEGFVRKSMADLAAVTSDYEIVFVNDGSTDRTADIAHRLQAEYPQLRVVDLPETAGTGANMLAGYRAATKDWIFNNTVDAFFDTRDLPKFIPHLGEFDVLSGYRTDLSANNPYQKLLTTVNYSLIHNLFPLKLQGYQTVQFHRRTFLNRITLESRSSFVSPELLLKAHYMGMRIQEIPVKYHPRKGGQPKGGKVIHVARSMRDILRAWFRWVIQGRTLETDLLAPEVVGSRT